MKKTKYVMNSKLKDLLENLIGVNMEFEFNPTYSNSEFDVYECTTPLPKGYLYKQIQARVIVFEGSKTIIRIETTFDYVSGGTNGNIVGYIYDGNEIKPQF